MTQRDQGREFVGTWKDTRRFTVEGGLGDRFELAVREEGKEPSAVLSALLAWYMGDAPNPPVRPARARVPEGRRVLRVWDQADIEKWMCLVEGTLDSETNEGRSGLGE